MGWNREGMTVPARRTIPKASMHKFLELRDDRSMNIHQKGDQIRQCDPDFWADPPRLDRNIYVACYRQAEDSGFADEVAAAQDKLPRPVELPPMLEKLDRSYKDVLLFSDNHLPFHDIDVIAEGLVFAKTHKLRRCVLNGDTLDLHWASNYTNLSGEDHDESFAQLAQFFVALLDHGLSEILLNFGNHEDRISRMTHGKLHLWSLIAMAIDTLPSRDRMRVRKAVTATNRPYIRFTDTPDGIDWVIGHPRRYRGKRLSLAADIALKWAKCHVATGHEHHIGWTITDCGSYFAVNLPCTQAAERTEYLQMDMSPTARPLKGFGWIIDGMPGLMPEIAPEPYKRAMMKPRTKSKKRRAA